MIREIIEIGNPILRKSNSDVEIEKIQSEYIKKIIQDLLDTRSHENGAGIAAPQIGENVNIFIVEVNDNPRYPYKPNIPLTIAINPTLQETTKETFYNYEGCLSVPNLRGIVHRYTEINFSYYDELGNYHVKELKGITAGTFQHEFDHLKGLLFTDRISDPKSLVTWNSFQKFHKEAFIEHVKKVVAKFGS